MSRSQGSQSEQSRSGHDTPDYSDDLSQKLFNRLTTNMRDIDSDNQTTEELQ